jgi:hypothetical protein
MNNKTMSNQTMSNQTMNNLTISQVTKCIKRNKQNIKININSYDEFTQGYDFIVYRKKKDIKDEIKTISSNILNDTSSVINYNFNEIIDIPNKLDDIFDNQLGSNYYLYGVNKENSFLISLLYIFSKEFKMKTQDKQLIFSKELQELLIFELPTYFKKYKYSSFGFKMTSIIENINSNNVDEGVLRYIYDYYKVNIVVLDYNNDKYLTGTDYNDNYNEKNIIIIKNENIYLPLVNMFGSMTSKLLYKCIINKLKINKEISSNIVVEQIIPNNYNNVIEQSKNIVLKACSSYKLSDLQDIANKFNISITKDVNGKTKNKTKQTLYDELKNM